MVGSGSSGAGFRPAAGLDRPWHRPGAARYACARLRGILRPPVTVYEPGPGAVVSDREVAVPMRDGTVLRVDAHRPPGPGPFPVLLCAHPYGKNNLPRRRGRRSRFSVQYRIMRQPAPVSFSVLTSWEAPDPAWWVGQGYAVVNADLRGSGTSEGIGSLMSDAEGQDVYDLVEWAGRQPWSTGRVGMLGVSYLAMSQYRVAALAPPSLRAICPWEGMTDPYRDLMRPGGLRERGFTLIWANGTKRTSRLDTDIAREQRRRPLIDAWWCAHTPDLTKITVPMLVCTSFADNALHSRGSFRAFERAASPHRYAYTHRGGKWTRAEEPGTVGFPTGRRAAAFTFQIPADLELTGPMALRLWLSVDGADDVNLVVGVEKWRGGRYIGFEGSYGFGRDRVATGWQKASLRELDERVSTAAEPAHTYRTRRALGPGEVVPVDIALGPSSTLFRAGETLRLVVAGRWLWPTNPLTGNFPARYARGPAGRVTLHWGPEHPARLLVPRIPPGSRPDSERD